MLFDFGHVGGRADKRTAKIVPNDARSANICFWLTREALTEQVSLS